MEKKFFFFFSINKYLNFFFDLILFSFLSFNILLIINCRILKKNRKNIFFKELKIY